MVLAGILLALSYAANQIQLPYQMGHITPISLSPYKLPEYAANTVFRMLMALIFSLLCTFIIAPLAAKNRQAEKFIIPAIDILQSVPILGVLSITVVGFIQLFPNSYLGPECAAIFAIFTSQVWNMILSLYQSLKTTPKTYLEAAHMFHLSTWQRFWKIEVPHAMPGLLWNMMVSVSAGWFYVVACEAIFVSNQHILLPGIGSYISVAIGGANIQAIIYAILTMFIVIVLYDQLFFRPLIAWADRFHEKEMDDLNPPSAWVYTLLLKTKWLKAVQTVFDRLTDYFVNGHYLSRTHHFKTLEKEGSFSRILSILWNTALLITLFFALVYLWDFISHVINLTEIEHVFYLGAITALKVTLLIILASLFWVPIGIWVGLHPNISAWVQPLSQFMAAFPVNLIYPVIVTGILHFHLNVEIWSTPLMILGTQWYILFNVIAGASGIPKELRYVTQNLKVKGALWWKRLALPAIFPYYVTGAMTAAGGCWNASIVADVLQWGDNTLISTGLGSYIAEHTMTGDFPRIALGIFVMCFYVLLFNRLVWQKLYNLAANRFLLLAEN